MFSGQGEAQGTLGLSRGADARVYPRRRSTPAIPSFPATSSRAQAVVTGPEIGGKSAVIVERKRSGQLSVGVDRVTTPAEAAHALASIRKSQKIEKAS